MNAVSPRVNNTPKLNDTASSAVRVFSHLNFTSSTVQFLCLAHSSTAAIPLLGQFLYCGFGSPMGAKSYADKVVKKRCHRPRPSRSTLSKDARSLSAKQAAATKFAITSAIALERKHQGTKVVELAKQFKLSASSMRERIMGASMFRKQRKVNKFNAWVHCRSLDVNESVLYSFSSFTLLTTLLQIFLKDSA